MGDLPLRRRPRAAGPRAVAGRLAAVREQLHGSHGRRVRSLALMTTGITQVDRRSRRCRRSATERLTRTVLKGKQLFYDARDARLARDRYMSCATLSQRRRPRRTRLGSHRHGRRTAQYDQPEWPRGDGARFLHWSANFDELQDFEGQIRALAGGTGLMTDADFRRRRAASRSARPRPASAPISMRWRPMSRRCRRSAAARIAMRTAR